MTEEKRKLTPAQIDQRRQAAMKHGGSLVQNSGFSKLGPRQLERAFELYDLLGDKAGRLSIARLLAAFTAFIVDAMMRSRQIAQGHPPPRHLLGYINSLSRQLRDFPDESEEAKLIEAVLKEAKEAGIEPEASGHEEPNDE